MNPIKRFLLTCSGADLTILDRPECGIEHNRYMGIGATILATAVLASISGGYALYTVFQSEPLSLAFGVLWGTIIFNLDRYIVSTLKKVDIDSESSVPRRVGLKLKEVVVALPRLILAVFISVVITSPIELRLFEHEVLAEVRKRNVEESTRVNQKVSDKFSEIQTLEQQTEKLKGQIRAKEQQSYDIQQQMFGELDGWGGTKHAGPGPVFKEKERGFQRANDELNDLKKENEPIIKMNEERLALLRAQRDEEARRANEPDDQVEKGLLKRMRALSSLRDADPTVAWASAFIVLLFILLETAPIFVKIFSERGPYDDIYETLEHEVYANEQKRMLEINEQVRSDLQRKRSERGRLLETERQLTRKTMDSLETLAGPEILEAQMEIAQLLVARWRKAELARLQPFTRPAAPAHVANGNGAAFTPAPEAAQTGAAGAGPGEDASQAEPMREAAEFVQT